MRGFPVGILRVSILTGPEEPVLRDGRQRGGLGYSGFNPHRPRRAGATIDTSGTYVVGLAFQSSPAPKSRCYMGGRFRPVAITCFNPHRPRRAGATGRRPVIITLVHVSILTGPEEPVLRVELHHAVLDREFQSSPAPKSRCYFVSAPRRSGQWSFNPHRPRRAGATVAIQARAAPRELFQSSPAPKSRCYAG